VSRGKMAAVGLVGLGLAVLAWAGLSSFLSGDAGPRRLAGPMVGTGGAAGDLFSGTPLPTVEAVGLPADAQALPPGDYGVDVGQGGGIRGSWQARGVGCENEGLIRVDTDRGSFLAGVALSPGVSCELLLGQWRRAAAASTMVGVRYIPGTDRAQRGLTIVNERGVSIHFPVGGAWRIP